MLTELVNIQLTQCTIVSCSFSKYFLSSRYTGAILPRSEQDSFQLQDPHNLETQIRTFKFQDDESYGRSLHEATWETDEVKINYASRAWKGLTKEEILSQGRNYIFHGHEGEGCFLTEETLRAKSCHKVQHHREWSGTAKEHGQEE